MRKILSEIVAIISCIMFVTNVNATMKNKESKEQFMKWFVFISDRGDKDGNDTKNYDIYIQRIDGSEVRRLTTKGKAWAPALSPDGKKIAFIQNKGIYVMNFDGSALSQLRKNSSDPAWSWDSKQLAFISNGEIYTMKADGSRVTRLTNSKSAKHNPAWSPDGKKIAFSSFQEKYGFDIFMINIDGKNQTRLTESKDFWEFNPTWSPDGKHIAYASFDMRPYAGINFQLYIIITGEIALIYKTKEGSWKNQLPVAQIGVIDKDGSNFRQLTKTKSTNWSPSWLPDGEYILFGSKRDGNGEIYLMKTDGSGITNLTNDKADDCSPDW